MKKDKKVWYWILFLIFFEALLFSYCYQFNPEYFMFESILLVLGIGAVCFLSELLITWMIILSFALSIFILVSGVVYISLQDTLVAHFWSRALCVWRRQSSARGWALRCRCSGAGRRWRQGALRRRAQMCITSWSGTTCPPLAKP